MDDPEQSQMPAAANLPQSPAPERQNSARRDPEQGTDFSPVAIRGEGLSATVLRDRR